MLYLVNFDEIINWTLPHFEHCRKMRGIRLGLALNVSSRLTTSGYFNYFQYQPQTFAFASWHLP